MAGFMGDQFAMVASIFFLSLMCSVETSLYRTESVDQVALLSQQLLVQYRKSSNNRGPHRPSDSRKKLVKKN